MQRRTDITVVIATYGRERVLLDTVEALLPLLGPADRVIIVDQTENHEPEVHEKLRTWQQQGHVRVINLRPASITRAMNEGLRVADTGLVLFVDDDIIPEAHLLEGHRETFVDHAQAWVSAGQVLQPGEDVSDQPWTGPETGLRGFLDFAFCSSRGQWITNVMAGNVCVDREHALAVGGFDEQFTPPVAYRFETEFAKRLCARGGRIRFQPAASIRHLRAGSGGTRIHGSHLSSASPVHGVGDYYYALRCGQGADRLRHLMTRPLREVRTRFHLKHPWFIPIKLVGECRALANAIRLYRSPPRLIGGS